MSIVSNNIKYLRRLNGLTQEQFARRIGIKRSLLGAYEEARANPNLENLKMIAQVFGTSVDALIKTDIRKIRDTPGLIGGSASPNPYKIIPETQQPTAVGNIIADLLPPVPVVASMPPVQEPTIPAQAPAIQKVVDKYYRTPNQVRLVSQRVVPKRINTQVFDKEPSVPSALPAPTAVVSATVEDTGTEKSTKIGWVSATQQSEYLHKYMQTRFTDTLPTLTLPQLSPDKRYRAFEMGNDFPLAQATVIGQLVQDWNTIKDGKHYLLIVPQHGVLYRRVYSQAKIKGTLLLSSDEASIASMEIALKDLAELWECTAFVSYTMPEPRLPLDHIKKMVQDLKQELDRL